VTIQLPFNLLDPPLPGRVTAQHEIAVPAPQLEQKLASAKAAEEGRNDDTGRRSFALIFV
jgi:hypothetical protein